MIPPPQVPLILVFVLSTTTVGCNSTDDGEPLEPSDAKLEEAIEHYCDIVVPCYPGMWEEPEHDNCVAQQEEWAAKSPECRKARFDFTECIVELGSCEALGEQPCRIEHNVASELRCDEL
jgi:hypothetical protein